MSYIPPISIPPGFKEDSKKFTVSSVGASPVAHQLTELEDGSEYIIKEVRVYFSGTRSFRMFDGNLNGKINDTLSTKPYLFVCAGTGASSQTVYGSVRYYYK